MNFFLTREKSWEAGDRFGRFKLHPKIATKRTKEKRKVAFGFFPQDDLLMVIVTFSGAKITNKVLNNMIIFILEEFL